MPRYSLLFLCFLVTPALAVEGEGSCYIPFGPVPTWSFPGPPLTADCQTIVSHIPALPQDAFDSANQDPGSTRFSSNFPILPEATFHHKSCVVRIACHPPPQPWTEDDWYKAIAQHQQPFTSSAQLSASSILRLWTTVRAVTQMITDECPSKQLNGEGWAPADIPEVANVWCSVHVLGYNTRGWEYRARFEGARVMKGSSRSQRGTGGDFQNKFRTTIIDVP